MINLDILHNKELTGRGQGKTTRLLYDVIAQAELGNINDIVIIVHNYRDVEFNSHMLYRICHNEEVKVEYFKSSKMFKIFDCRVRFVVVSDIAHMYMALLGTRPLFFDARDYYFPNPRRNEDTMWELRKCLEAWYD